MLKFKKIAVGCLLATLALSSTAFASEMGSATYSVTRKTSANKVLGSHTHHLNAYSANSHGAARAKKVMRLAPDVTVAHISLKNTGEKASKSFVSSHFASDGVTPQNYYIQFDPVYSTSSFYINIAHQSYY